MNLLSRKVVAPTITAIYFFTSIFGGVSFVYADPGDETTYYLLTDHLGSVDVVLDDQGEVVERRDYLPYGSERVVDEASDAPTTDQNFTGKDLDDETGLHYYGARYYDSETGHFVSVDPWGGDLTNPQSFNKYSYTFNNPLKYNDPSGRNPILIAAPPVAEIFMTAVIAAYMVAKAVIVDSGNSDTSPYVIPAHSDTSPNHIADEVPVEAPSINTGHEAPTVQTPTHTGGNVSVEPDINILPTPAYQPENTGACGTNMSCSTLDKDSLPIYGLPNATEIKWKKGIIDQGRTRDASGNPTKDIDFSDHGNPTKHSDPHEHEWNSKEDGTYDHTSRGPPINN